MLEACKYFKFLSSKESIELIKYAQTGIPIGSVVPTLNRKQYYDRLRKARLLGLVIKKDNMYRLTAFGEMLVEKARIINELNSMEYIFKSIDAQEDDEARLALIHQLFNKRPDLKAELENRLVEGPHFRQ